MNILLYGRTENAITEKLWNMILEFVDQKKAKKHSTILSLANSLIRDRNSAKIVLLLATTKGDLRQLLSLKELLSDTRIILVLPDGDHDTISMAHTFYPRFLTYMDSNFNDVRAVVSKMVDKFITKESYSHFNSTAADNI